MSDHIPIIEEEPKLAKPARDYLEKYGYRTLTAGDGREVCRRLRPVRTCP